MPIIVYRSADEARGRFGPCAVTIGNFDGVHLGHQALLREVMRDATEHGWKASVLTFHPHPIQVLAPERAPKLLTSLAEREHLMARCGIGQALVLPFHQQLASLGPEEFVRQILVGALEARSVVVGENFRFGHRQAGDVRVLGQLGEQYGFQVKALPPVRWRGAVVSSSSIRQALVGGRVTAAARQLGRFHAIAGPVVKGHGIGSKQTVPTLNLDPVEEVLPAGGVYVTRTYDLDSERQWPSVTNIGVRPTFGGERLSVETYLLRPLDGAGPERIRVAFTHRLREERRFSSPELLKAQILRDVTRAQAWHRRARRWPPDILES